MFVVIRVTRYFNFPSCFDNKSMLLPYSHFSRSNFDLYSIQYHLYSYFYLVYFPHRYAEKEALQQVNIAFQINHFDLISDDRRILLRKRIS